MLRWARRIAIFLLLGAIVNVAVAWGCVLRGSWGTSKRTPASIAYSGRPITFVYEEWHVGVQVLSCDDNEQTQRALVWKDRDGGWIEYAGDLHNEDWTRNVPAARTRAGWPCLALEGWQSNSFGAIMIAPGNFNRTDFTHWGLVLNDVSDSWLRPSILPLRPLMRGFAINTVMYGSILLSVGLAPAAVRAAVRKRDGRCPTCGYPRGTSPVCTECGEALPGVAAK